MIKGNLELKIRLGPERQYIGQGACLPGGRPVSVPSTARCNPLRAELGVSPDHSWVAPNKNTKKYLKKKKKKTTVSHSGKILYLRL